MKGVVFVVSVVTFATLSSCQSGSSHKLGGPDWDSLASAANSIRSNYPPQMELVVEAITAADAGIGSELAQEMEYHLHQRFLPLVDEQLIDRIQSKQLSPQKVVTTSNELLQAGSNFRTKVDYALRSLPYEKEKATKKVEKIWSVAAKVLNKNLPVINCGVGGDGGEFCNPNSNPEFSNLLQQLKQVEPDGWKLFEFIPVFRNMTFLIGDPNPNPDWRYLAWHASVSKTFIPMFFKYAAFHGRLENQTLTEVAERKANGPSGLAKFYKRLDEILYLIDKQALSAEDANQKTFQAFLSVDCAISKMLSWDMRVIQWMRLQLRVSLYAEYLALFNMLGIMCEFYPTEYLCFLYHWQWDKLKQSLPQSTDELTSQGLEQFLRFVENEGGRFQGKGPFLDYYATGGKLGFCDP